MVGVAAVVVWWARLCEIRRVPGLSRRGWVRVAVASWTLAGCRGQGTQDPTGAPTQAPTLSEARLFAAPGGAAQGVPQLLSAMAASDVVLIGELHEHPLGLGLAATLFEQLLASPAGEKAALCLESLTRDQQGAVDAYLRGETSEAAFRKAAQLEGDRSYPPGHRRMVEAAKRKGRPVIAANTARALVKRARLEGLEPLRSLPPEQQAWVDVPAALTEGEYRAGFLALMGGHGGVDAATMEGFFRAQNVWDATMAGSIVRALTAGMRPVVQVVGSFHVDGAGGLYQRVREGAPEARVWRMSMVAEAAEQLRVEDSERGDVVA